MAYINSKTMLSEAVSLLENELNVRYANDSAQMAQALMLDKKASEVFTEGLMSGLHEAEKQDFIQFNKNCDQVKTSQMFYENVSANVANFAVLDKMVVRDIWSRTGAKNAMTYKVMNQPQITLPWLKQYITTPEGQDIDIPTAINAAMMKSRTIKKEITIQNRQGIVTDILQGTTPTIGAEEKYRLTLGDLGKLVKFDCSTQANGAGTAVNGVIKEIRPDTNGAIYGRVEFKQGETTYVDTIMGHVDRVTREIKLFSEKDLIKKVYYEVKLSPETNFSSYNFTQKAEKINIEVGDGDTINSDIPIQYLQDMNALFNIDAVANASEMISKNFALAYDLECYATFVDNVVANSDQCLEYDASMLTGVAHNGISRAMQNSELLDKVIRGIGFIDSRYNFSGSTDYYVLCNPIENSIMAGAVVADYSGTTAQGGTIKPYAAGRYVQTVNEAGAVRVISSNKYTSGKVYIVPKSDVDSEIGFGYYDYAQVLMPFGAYRNPKNPNVPNISCNKRKKIHTFRGDYVQEITVKNNNK